MIVNKVPIKGCKHPMVIFSKHKMYCVTIVVASLFIHYQAPHQQMATLKVFPIPLMPRYYKISHVMFTIQESMMPKRYLL